MENIVKYEVLNKETGIWLPATKVTIGNELVTYTTAEGDVTFSNIGVMGDLQNDQYAVRIMETEGQADGTGFVTDEGVETEVAPEVEQ